MNRVHVIVSPLNTDRIIGRMARHLGELPGVSVGEKPDPSADLNYYLPYLELTSKTAPKVDTKKAAYFTHIEPGQKARMWEAAAKEVDLRVITAPQYADALSVHGPTVRVTPPVDLKHFKPGTREPNSKPVVGVSGFVYAGGRKGEKLVRMAAQSETGRGFVWKAAGKGWPVKTQMYSWDKLPGFYRSLDVYLCAATIEGVPMPPLEAMACGVRCVIPRGVGLLDELPDLDDLYRYDVGDLDSMLHALELATFAVKRGIPVDRDALRGAVAGYTADAWREDHARAFAQLFAPTADAPQPDEYGYIAPDISTQPPAGPSVLPAQPQVRVLETDCGGIGVPLKTDRGIYVVAYGAPARECARRLLASIRTHMPEIPTMLVGDVPVNAGETTFVEAPRGDIGARSVKTQIYDRAPAEWQYVLYLDADTELIKPVPFLFQILESGWDFTICKNPQRFHTAKHMVRPDNGDECRETFKLWGTDEMMQWNGGVFGFRRSDATRAFFHAWHKEWTRYAKRDQAALLRALWAHPLKLYPLGNEWNLVPTYDPVSRSAGIVHHVTEAREWGKGIIAARGDSPQAFAQVARNRRNGKGEPHMAIVNSRTLGRGVNPPRGGPLVKVEIRPGQYIRVTAREAERLRAIQEEKARRQVDNKMRVPAEIK